MIMSIIYLTLLSIICIRIDGHQRENLAVRHPCYTINKRLEPYIIWTEKLASSQYQGPKDGCTRRSSAPVCCTYEILDSYAKSLEIELKLLIDAELNRLSVVLLSSKQQIEDWIGGYISESHRLTSTALETLFGKNQYRLHIHRILSNLFAILSDPQASADDVSKSAVELFNQLIISSYRRFTSSDPEIHLDEQFQRCLITKAFDINALANQRQLLYTWTSTFSSFQILRTLLIYIDADLQRLNNKITWPIDSCTQRYARESLCPICLSDRSNDSFKQTLCPHACRSVLRDCFNQTNNPYMAFAHIARGYATIIKAIEQSVIELKLIEHLSKVHIYLYDMVINATNNPQVFTQLKNACPHPQTKAFTRLRSLPPISAERRALVDNWNRSLQYLFHQLKSSIENLSLRLSQQIVTDICSNVNYAVKSSRCTQIDQHKPSNLIQWSYPSTSPPSTSSWNIHLQNELTRNQLDDLKKKMALIEQMIISLQPKKKYVLIEYLPDFDSYDNDLDLQENSGIHSSSSVLIDDVSHEHQGSLSEQLYKEIEQQTTRRTSTRHFLPKTLSNYGPSISSTWSMLLLVFVLIASVKIV